MAWITDEARVLALRQAMAQVLDVPVEQVEGGIIIAQMADGTFMLAHNANTTDDARNIAQDVFAAHPDFRDEIVAFLL